MTVKDYKPAYNRVYTTLKHQEPDIVPVFAGIGTFAIGYANSTIQEVESSAEKEVEVYLKPHERLYCDAVHFAGLPYGPVGSEIIGSPSRFISPDGTTAQHLACAPMEEGEYDLLINDTENFIWNTCVPRTAKKLALPYKEKKAAMEKFMDYYDQKFEAWGQISSRLKNEYGRIVLHDAGSPIPPMDLINDYLRDIHGLSKDIRRQPEKVLAACEAVNVYCLRRAGVGDGYETKTVPEFPMYATYLHFPPFIGPKQFERFFAPTYTEILRRLDKIGGKIILFLEGGWMDKADWLKSLPKDFICAVYEGKDIAELKKRVGSVITLIGGMEANDIKYLSAEVCKEKAKAVVDELAPGGGYMFGLNLELCSKNDINFDTYCEVCDFVHEYGRY